MISAHQACPKRGEAQCVYVYIYIHDSEELGTYRLATWRLDTRQQHVAADFSTATRPEPGTLNTQISLRELWHYPLQQGDPEQLGISLRIELANGKRTSDVLWV